MHIPACQTTQLELISFDQALEEAQAVSYTHLWDVILSRKKRADRRVTKTGEVYSSTAATDMELVEMAEK